MLLGDEANCHGIITFDFVRGATDRKGGIPAPAFAQTARSRFFRKQGRLLLRNSSNRDSLEIACAATVQATVKHYEEKSIIPENVGKQPQSTDSFRRLHRNAACGECQEIGLFAAMHRNSYVDSVRSSRAR
jgi:hypothetical protein